jgi:D-alanyl-lipoteichoic acid acyltransferase DltB (MBOAT superfamily)
MTTFFSGISVTSAVFFVFILIVFAIYYIVPKKYQNLVLLLGSYLFCISWDWTFAAALFIISLINFALALRISSVKGKDRAKWLWFGIALNVGGLFLSRNLDQTQYYFFKALFRVGFTNNLFNLHLLQPIGISFYTLQAISYLVDVYREQIPVNKNFMEVSLYLAYFPKLLAGPIERADNFFNQLRANRSIDNNQIIESLSRIFIGLIRKIVISDSISRMIPAKIFTNPETYSTPDLIFWWLVFAFVIYNDFAGYTSIARGVSGLFGIQLSQNFEQPFFSTSYIDFWNRWHMSLSNWLRDYIYLPVSRAMLHRNPSGRYLPNLIVPPLVTMIVSGIWHGANPHFLLWGILNGLLQGAERVQKSLRKASQSHPDKWKLAVKTIWTIIIIVLINVPFKFDIAQALTFWGILLKWDAVNFALTMLLIKPVLAIFLSLFMDFAQAAKKDETGFLLFQKKTQIALLALGILLLFLSTRQQAASPFIYQEF